jgi:hypothetical protein
VRFNSRAGRGRRKRNLSPARGADIKSLETTILQIEKMVITSRKGVS